MYAAQIECDAKRIYCGTTALGAFVIGSRLLVFNIGDCQAVLCSAGQAVSLFAPILVDATLPNVLLHAAVRLVICLVCLMMLTSLSGVFIRVAS